MPTDIKILIRRLDDPPTPYSDMWQADAWGGMHDLWAPVGLAWIGECEGRAQIQFIFTMPGHRRQGVATAILDAVQERWPDGPVSIKPHTKAGRALKEAHQCLTH